MGLNRVIKITVKDLPEDDPFVGEIAELLNEMYDVGFCNGNQSNVTEPVSWWELHDDMVEFSLFFPDVIFQVDVEESVEGFWRGYFKEGKSQICESEVVYEEFKGFDQPSRPTGDSYIKSVTTYNTGGHIYNDVIELKNGVIIRISEDLIGVFKNEEADEKGDHLVMTEY